jgi:hypothetical protein
MMENGNRSIDHRLAHNGFKILKSRRLTEVFHSASDDVKRHLRSPRQPKKGWRMAGSGFEIAVLRTIAWNFTSYAVLQRGGQIK